MVIFKKKIAQVILMATLHVKQTNVQERNYEKAMLYVIPPLFKGHVIRG